jgi:hypothetical protein
MARVKPRKNHRIDYLEAWEQVYKPLILSYHGEVPISVVAEVLGISVSKVQEQLLSGAYNYGIARKCDGDTYRYEFAPLRLIAWVEGKMS